MPFIIADVVLGIPGGGDAEGNGECRRGASQVPGGVEVFTGGPARALIDSHMRRARGRPEEKRQKPIPRSVLFSELRQ